MTKNEKVEKLKELTRYYSFFLQNKNSYNFAYPSKDKNYVLFPRKGLIKQKKIKITSPIKEKLGIKGDYINVSGEEKIKIKKKTIKASKKVSCFEEKLGKKIALFLDKKAIGLLQKEACWKTKKEINKYSSSDIKEETNKYYKFKRFLENSVLFFSHDPKCIGRGGIIEASNLVFLINPKMRPKKLLDQLNNENDQWYQQETLLLHLVKTINASDLGSRDIATCKLVPSKVAFIAYEYDALWMWFDIENININEEERSATINYCIKVAKKCVCFHYF